MSLVREIVYHDYSRESKRSSSQFFVLWFIVELGRMRGHRLRLETERNRVHLSTDISVGAVYGAMKRLASEGLLREASRELEGNRPARQIYVITQEGRHAPAALRREGPKRDPVQARPFRPCPD